MLPIPHAGRVRPQCASKAAVIARVHPLLSAHGKKLHAMHIAHGKICTIISNTTFKEAGRKQCGRHCACSSDVARTSKEAVLIDLQCIALEINISTAELLGCRRHTVQMLDFANLGQFMPNFTKFTRDPMHSGRCGQHLRHCRAVCNTSCISLQFGQALLQHTLEVIAVAACAVDAHAFAVDAPRPGPAHA